MRALAFKLTLAFLLVGLTGSLLVAVIIQNRTRNAFDQFILTREQQVLVEYLVRYYQSHGGWEGVANNLRTAVESSPRGLEAGRSFRRGLARFTLVGPDQRVAFSTISGQDGEKVSSRELERAIPLVVDGNRAGWLLLTSNPLLLVPNSPEAVFLRNINRATLVSALVAVVLALVLGSFLAFTLTRSLRELKEATEEIARGRLGRQVKIRSQDELGELAASFNKMSLDLQMATQARRQMTADIAHELRSPLSVIAGYAEALSDGKLPGTPEVYKILYQESRQLSRLVEDLRTLSLADAGELQLNLQPIDPRTILEQAVARHAVAAQQREIVLRLELEPDPRLVSVDPERISQVLDNLILNSFRYTPPGGEIVLANKNANGKVQLQVRDNGSGIASEDLPHIFDRFYRGDRARPQNGESGLGLAIAKSIVEAHGGSITVESQPGEMTVFTISIGL